MKPTAATPPPTLWVVEDDRDARFAIETLAVSVGLPVQTFASGEEFLKAFSSDLRGCVMSDFRLPRLNGLELLGELQTRGSHMPFIMVSGHADVPVAVSAIKSGAFDFLQKPVVLQEALDRIHAALAEEQRRYESRRRVVETSGMLESLSKRESEILELMVEGKKNREIAAKLEISERTVEIHRARVMQKTGCGSLAELTRLFLQTPKSS